MLVQAVIEKLTLLAFALNKKVYSIIRAKCQIGAQSVSIIKGISAEFMTLKVENSSTVCHTEVADT